MHTMCGLCTMHSAFKVSSFGYRLLALKYNKLIFRVDPFESTEVLPLRKEEILTDAIPLHCVLWCSQPGQSEQWLVNSQAWEHC